MVVQGINANKTSLEELPFPERLIKVTETKNFMSFIVMTSGRENMNLFLVDRSKTKSRWWTTDWQQAMHFNKETAAQTQANKLRYKQPTVITINEAIKLSNDNDVNQCEDHTFSSDGLGQ